MSLFKNKKNTLQLAVRCVDNTSSAYLNITPRYLKTTEFTKGKFSYNPAIISSSKNDSLSMIHKCSQK